MSQPVPTTQAPPPLPGAGILPQLLPLEDDPVLCQLYRQVANALSEVNGLPDASQMRHQRPRPVPNEVLPMLF